MRKSVRRKKTMKIDLVTETFPPEVNGVSMTLERLALGLIARGHQLCVIRPRQHKDDYSGEAQGLLHKTVPGLPLPRYEGLHIGLPVYFRLRRGWQNRRPDMVHVATEGPLGAAAIFAARSLGIPLISSFHTNFHSYGKHYGYGWALRIALCWLRYLHNKTQITFAPSPDLVEVLKTSGFRNLDIFGRGVDTQLFQPSRRDEELRRSWGAETNTPVAIYVGRLAGEKNIPLTVEAMLAMRKILPDLRIVLVGDGPEKNRLQRKYPDIHFAGLRRGEDLARHYASGDCFIFASETETFGNVVTEAMASGLVVLAYDYAAPRKYIAPNINGRLVPFGENETFLAEASKLAQDLSQWPEMRRQARETAQSVSWDSVIDYYVKQVENLLSPA